MNLVDMTGKPAGCFTVLERAPNAPGSGNARWLCRCVCGGLVTIPGIQLRYKPPQHCGNCRPKRPGTVSRIGRPCTVRARGGEVGLEKRCVRCGEFWPAESFTSHPQGAFGLDNRCHACRAEQRREVRSA